MISLVVRGSAVCVFPPVLMGYTKYHSYASRDKTLMRRLDAWHYAGGDEWRGTPARLTAVVHSCTRYSIFECTLQSIFAEPVRSVVSKLLGQKRKNTTRGYRTLCFYAKQQKKDEGQRYYLARFFRSRLMTANRAGASR